VLSADGTRLLTSSASAYMTMEDGKQKLITAVPATWIFDTKTKQKIAEFPTRGMVMGMDIYPDGRRALLLESQGILRQWDLEKLEMTATTKLNNVRNLAISGDGKVAALAMQKQILLIDADTLAPIRSL